MLSASLIQLEYVPKQWKSTFSYSPLVLWWPPLSHFRKKGIFFGLSLVSTSTLKYLQSLSHRKMGAHHGWRPFAALIVQFPTEDSALLALPGLLWLGWVRLGACQTCAYASLPPRRSVDTTQTQDTLYTLAWVLVNLLATCDLS